ncbi:hemerythrin domain-containing protein [Microlunatus soli]|uniref:Hemerythrin HHE cation binding domain-containing protein n=1 Tax=Microlunatus soli TaxID=630515 RepID=A0A1H1V8T2_9ACTN|nr:hemerythrin domain-containing protein [Microlunatus soli]SDS81040.1 Hemerythrin HHE cation binding domain-containing protein [Microlunatus soli]
MTEGEHTRLIAWSQELRAVHQRLRTALRVTRDALEAGEASAPATRELLMFCHGFCTALTGHHQSEDRELFPAVAAAHPELAGTLRQLRQDHSMIGYLVAALQDAVGRNASPVEIDRHLDGVAAIMENHFRYEEQQLLTILDTLGLDADPHDVLGPL